MDAVSLDLLAKSGGWAAVLMFLIGGGAVWAKLAVIDNKLDNHFSICKVENHRKK